jgi:hypothetical protein
MFRLRALKDSRFQFRIQGTEALVHDLRSEATRSFHELYPGASLKGSGNELILSVVGSGRVVVSDVVVLYQVRDAFALAAGSVLNVKDYGATGDPTNKGTDSAALKAAIDASHEGDAIYFPGGTYLVDEPLEAKPHRLYFSLTDLAVLQATAKHAGSAMFVVGDGPVEFQRLTIDGGWNGTDPPVAEAAGIRRSEDAGGALDVVVTNCRIRNACGDGIGIAGGKDPRRVPDRVIVRDTVVEHCGGNGLGFGKIANVRVESSRFERCNNGVKLLGCEDVVVHGVAANENRRHGIVFTFSHRWHVADCVARGNGPTATDQKGGWGIAAGGEAAKGLQPNSDFTITNNVCEHNVTGGITLDPTMEDTPATIWSQRARVSGNVCRSDGAEPGIHVTHSSDVVVSDNTCCTDSAGGKGSGIQIVSSSHVLAHGNVCFGKHNGIGLFSNEAVTDPGYHVLGTNMLDRNDVDVLHQRSGQGQPLTGVRIHGLHGKRKPDGKVEAEPGTLYEQHEDGQDGRGALYVKETGSDADGWRRAVTEDSG